MVHQKRKPATNLLLVLLNLSLFSQLLANSSDNSASSAPNFDLIGYATLNGGTSGGAGGVTITARTLEDLQNYCSKPENLVLYVEGTISGGSEGAVVKVKSNKSLLGTGDGAFLDGVGLSIVKASNVIIRNIKFTMSSASNLRTNAVAVNDGDCVHVQDSQNVWIDHCEFFNIDPLLQPDKDLYDGLIDITHNSDHITVSYCYFHDHHKVSLLGQSDKFDHDTMVTFHHNYFRHVGSRLPSVRYGHGHVFNNYYSDIIGSAVHPRMGACLKVEKNYFEKAKNPIFTENGKEAGQWDLDDNLFLDCKGSQPEGSTCSLSIPYDYASVLEASSATVKDTVLQWAGVGKVTVVTE